MSREVSVIMGVCNEKPVQIKKAIDSILNQTFRNFELIIILDNPKNTKARETIKQIKDKRIKLYSNPKNLGLTKTLNRGIKFSSGKYIARMDADDFSTKDRFKEQFNYMEKNKNIDLCFTWTKYLDTNGNLIKTHSPKNSLCKNLKKNFFKGHLFVHPTLFCKSSVLRKNNYNEKHTKAQDFELWLRLIAKKYNFAIIEKYLFEYDMGDRANIKSRININLSKNLSGIKALLRNYTHYSLSPRYYYFLISIIIRTSVLIILKPVYWIKK